MQKGPEEEKTAEEVENLDPYDPTLDLPRYKYPTIDLLNEYDVKKVTVSRQELEENKDKIAGAIESVVPMTDEQKAKLHAAVNDPTSLMPSSVQRVVEVAKNAEQYKQKAIASLPISEAQKAQLTTAVNSVQQKVVNRVMQSPTVEVLPNTPTVEVVEENENNVPIQIILTHLDTTQLHTEVLHSADGTSTTTVVSSADSQPPR